MPGTANIVGEVNLLVKPLDPNGQFNAGVQSIIQKLEAQARFKIQASGLDEVQRGANGIGQGFAKASLEAAGLTAAIYGIKAGIQGVIAKFAGLFDQLAQARAGFTSILHSEAAGGALLDDIREFARVSPFVTQELVNYSQQLLGVGLRAKEIIPLLKSTGDIISAVGGDTQNLGRVLFTLTQIKSIGLLKGQDTMQLQNSLIPITKYLSEYLHKSSQEIVKLREAGLITADTVFNALNQQGEKVKGAMDRATRNIQGARAILSDTITQMFQDQPVLNKIFDAMFNSIKKLADKLGEAEFQEAFAQFFDGVDKVFEALKPIFSELAKVGGSGAITSLQLFGTVLHAVGSALNAIPKVALETFARLLVALGSIKAPLLLIRYIATIRTLAASLLPATLGLHGAALGQEALGLAIEETAHKYALETALLDENTAALTINQRAMLGRAFAAQQLTAKQQKVLNGTQPTGFLAKAKGAIKDNAVVGSALIATVGGQYLQEHDNLVAKTTGGALSYAGTGALIGSFLGPEGSLAGAAVGAAAGAIFGGLTSYFSETEAQAKAHIERMRAAGEAAADAFIAAEQAQFGSAPTSQKFSHKADELRAKREELFNLQNPQLPAQARFARETAGMDLSKSSEWIRNHPEADLFAKADKGKVEEATAQIERLSKTLSAETDPIINNIGAVVAGLDEGQKAIIGLTNAGKGKLRIDFSEDIGNSEKTAVNLERAAKALDVYGLSLSDIGNADNLENVIGIIRTFDHLTTAEQQATTAANKYNESLKAAKLITAQIYDPLETKIQEQIASLAVQKGQLAAAAAAGQDPNDKVKQLTFQDANLKAEEDARTRQIALDSVILENLKKKQALDIGKTGFSNITADTIATENNAAAHREAAVALAEHVQGEAFLAAALLGTRTLEAANTSLNIAHLEKLVHVVDNVQNRDIIIKINADAVQKATTDLLTFIDTKADVDKRANDRGLASSFDADLAIKKRNLELLAGATPIGPRETQYVNDYTDSLKAAFLAEQAMLGPWQDFLASFDQQKATGDLLGKLFEVSDDNVVQLNSKIENVAGVVRQMVGDSNQLFLTERGHGVDKAQAEADATADLWGNLELARLTLHLSNEEWDAMLNKIGIIPPAVEGLSGSFSDVAGQLGISDEHLAQIVGYTAALDGKVINMAITIDAQKAIETILFIENFAAGGGGSLATAGALADQYRKAKELTDALKSPDVTIGDAHKPEPGKGAKAAKEAVDKTQDAIDALTRRLEEAARAIADAADRWVGSIKERTQYEVSVSASRATRNADRQTKDLTEITAGLTTLKGRGLSDEAISSLSIDNVNDLKQVRKLLKATPTEIAALSTAVAGLETKSTEIATTQEDKRTRQNITEGILEAAKTLEIDFTKTDAAALGGQFTINTTTNAEDVATAIINALRAGATGR